MEEKHLREALDRIKKEMHGRFGEKVMKPAILTIEVKHGEKEPAEEGDGEPMSNEEDGKGIGIQGLLDSAEPPDDEKEPRKHKR